ncbi:MAG: hypothetical protein AAB971_00240 [Patescibacteria group bacterium]
MAEIPDIELWSQFNLGVHNNPDPGGGLLYALRYSDEHLDMQRNAVLRPIIDSSAEIIEVDSAQLAIDMSTVAETEMARVLVLLEELSIVNEAVEYQTDGGVTPMSLKDFAQGLIIGFFQGARARGMAKSLLYVEQDIPRIVSDLATADEQNGVLTKSERRILEGLSDFAAHHTDRLAGRHSVVLAGTEEW